MHQRILGVPLLRTMASAGNEEGQGREEEHLANHRGDLQGDLEMRYSPMGGHLPAFFQS
jgi:hypothetical protein